MDAVPSYLTLSPEELVTATRVRVEIVPDLPALFLHFARSVADEIRTNNAADKPTRLILPVGPVDQYPLLARICNQERISWRNVFTFNMDEYCDWQGRAVTIWNYRSRRTRPFFLIP
jgi:glucosamine-6-phosphate deaminase